MAVECYFGTERCCCQRSIPGSMDGYIALGLTMPGLSCMYPISKIDINKCPIYNPVPQIIHHLNRFTKTVIIPLRARNPDELPVLNILGAFRCILPSNLLACTVTCLAGRPLSNPQARSQEWRRRGGTSTARRTPGVCSRSELKTTDNRLPSSRRQDNTAYSFREQDCGRH